MPTDRGKVSIITPTYNHAEFIGPCIESVLGQTYPNLEMLIVDDGSTDGTAEKIKSYKDPRIVYLPLEHGGLEALGAHYNLALSKATGELIAILEGDDFWPEDKLERQVIDFRDPDVVLSSGLFQSTSSEGDPADIMPSTLPPTRALLNAERGAAAASMLSYRHLTFTFPVSTLIRRTALEAIGGFIQPPYLPLVDYPTFLNLSLQGKWTFHLHVLGYWRRHEGSVTTTRFLQILEGVYRYASEFVAVNRSSLPLADREFAALSDDWRLMQFDRLVLTGLMLLEQRDYKRAEEYFASLQAFPITRKWKVLSRILRGLASVHANPAFMRSLVDSKVPCRLQKDNYQRYLSGELPPETIQHYPLTG